VIVPTLRKIGFLICAAVLAFFGVFGIIRFHTSASGVTFHAFVLLCGAYLATLAIRRPHS
jgi:hypothetical protein